MATVESLWRGAFCRVDVFSLMTSPFVPWSPAPPGVWPRRNGPKYHKYEDVVCTLATSFVRENFIYARVLNEIGRSHFALC